MFIFQIKRELFQVKNGLTTSLILFFFGLMPKIWVGWMTLNGEKNEYGLNIREKNLVDNL